MELYLRSRPQADLTPNIATKPARQYKLAQTPSEFAKSLDEYKNAYADLDTNINELATKDKSQNVFLQTNNQSEVLQP